MINNLRYTKRLEEAGFSREQAETSMDILMEVMVENLATKHDLMALESKIELKFNDISHKLNEIGYKFDQQESKMTIKLGGMLIVAIGIMATLQKLL